MPNGATHSACTGGSSPGTAGIADSTADVVGARRAAADAHALAAPHVAVVGGAARDREIEVGAFEHARRRRAFGREPAVERLEHALDEQRAT